MSDFRAETWGPGDLEHHRQMFDAAVSHVEAQGYIFPDDARMHVGLGLLTMRGVGTAVHTVGTAGAAKTMFGDIAVGEGHRVTIEPTDTQESLVGFRNPINAQELVPGRIGAQPADPRFFFNEVAHLRNKAPLHAFWDGNFVDVNGQQVPLGDAVRYATSNFPDGRRNHPMDGAMRSRQAVEILAGDTDAEQNKRIHGRDIGKVNGAAVRDTYGVLPSVETSQDIRQVLGAAFPLSGDYTDYVSDILEVAERVPELNIIDANKADGRLSEGWQQTIRAMRLASTYSGAEALEAARGYPINSWAAAQTGALVLPTQIELSQVGKAKFREILGKPIMTPLEEAVALRQALAALSLKLWIGRMTQPVDTATLGAITSNFMDRFAYANPNGIRKETDEFIQTIVNSAGEGHRAVVDMAAGSVTHNQEGAGNDTKRPWRSRLSRRNRTK